ncbi:hypothetical protein [Actinomadura sp. GTD37]|uniref:hypothetical protein n=1 Tax=Actinomadura sp. GTD37 TaxID=1778030 RepID=UPI0035C18E27
MTDSAPPVASAPPPPTPSAKPPARRLRKAFRNVLVALLVVAAAFVAVDRVADKDVTVSRVEQPKSAEDEAGAQYVGLIRTTSRVFGRYKGHYLYIGDDPGLSYGHFEHVELNTGVRLRIETVKWEADGVRVAFNSGHELFVPVRYREGR